MPQDPTPARKLLRIYAVIAGMLAALLVFATIAHFAGSTGASLAALLCLAALRRGRGSLLSSFIPFDFGTPFGSSQRAALDGSDSHAPGGHAHSLGGSLADGFGDGGGGGGDGGGGDGGGGD